jgi:hypothetical protein
VWQLYLPTIAAFVVATKALEVVAIFPKEIEYPDYSTT